MRQISWIRYSPIVCLLVVLVLVPFLSPNLYYLGVMTTLLINVLLGVSAWFVLCTGQVTLGHAGFAAIGGYISAALVVSFGISAWLAIPAAIVAAGVVATVLGYVTLRITGVYFIVATVALGEVTRIFFTLFKQPFGGVVGIIGVKPPNAIDLFGLTAINFTSKPAFYYLVLVLVLIPLVVMYRIHSSQIGLVFRGIMQADNLAENVGVDIMHYKVLAFVIGSASAGLAGALFAFSSGSMLPGSFTIIQSIYYLLYVAIGGAAGIGGPILGAVFISGLDEVLRPFKEYEPIVLALLLIGATLFFKQGLLGLCLSSLHRVVGAIAGRKGEQPTASAEPN